MPAWERCACLLRKKRRLRKALAPILPAEILAARKQGFTLPAAEWLRGPLAPFARDALSVDRGILDVGASVELLDDHIARRRDSWRELWTLLSFCVWFDRYAA